MVDIYVDPDASGLDNGTSWTDAYTTLKFALNDIPDPPLDDYTIHCRSSAGSFDNWNTPTTKSWFNAGANRTVTIKCDTADFHNGQLDNGYWIYKNGSDNSFLTLYSGAFELVIDGLGFKGEGPASGGVFFMLQMEEEDLTVKNCFFYGGFDHLYVLPTLSNTYIYNNFFMNAINRGLDGSDSSNYQAGYNVAFYNNYLVGCDRNFFWDDDSGTPLNLYFKNNYLGDAGTGNDYNPKKTPVSNEKTATSDTSGTAGLQNIAHAVGSGTYVSELTPGVDLNIANSASGLFESGVDLSSDPIFAFAVDYKGNARTSPWSIGPHLYIDSSGGGGMQEHLLRSARASQQKLIDENPQGITLFRQALQDNGMGDLVPNPFGSTTKHKARVRIAHEQKGPFQDDGTSQGLSTRLSRFILALWNTDIRQNDIFSAIGKRWKVGPIDRLIKFGGTYGLQAPILEAE